MGGLSITAAGSGATGSTSGAATSSASTPALCWPSLEDGGREKTAIEGTEERERGYADTGPNNAGTEAQEISLAAQELAQKTDGRVESA